MIKTTMTTDALSAGKLKKLSVLSAAIVSSILLTSPASAAPEISINPSSTGSTTIVEQYSDGKVATVTSTPTGITMQSGMPYSVTQIANTPSYALPQGTTITSVPVPSQTSNRSNKVDVIAIPNSTVTQIAPQITTAPSIINITPAVTTTTLPVLTTNPPALATSEVISLDRLQLTPAFSTPDIVNANTKVMKILKDSSGREVAVPANSIRPGDVIEYHTTYVNTSTQLAPDINATVALPNGVKLVSLNSPLPTSATRGDNRYQTIGQMGNGVMIQDNYSNLRWNLANLPANTPQTVVIRAEVQ